MPFSSDSTSVNWGGMTELDVPGLAGYLTFTDGLPSDESWTIVLASSSTTITDAISFITAMVNFAAKGSYAGVDVNTVILYDTSATLEFNPNGTCLVIYYGRNNV